MAERTVVGHCTRVDTGETYPMTVAARPEPANGWVEGGGTPAPGGRYGHLFDGEDPVGRARARVRGWS